LAISRYSLMTSCIIVTSFLLYFEIMITGAFDREGQKGGKKNSEDSMQETEWMPNNGFWMPEIPENRSRKHETMKAQKTQGRQETGVSRRSRMGILEKWDNGMMRRGQWNS
jgi:hypothetical protein